MHTQLQKKGKNRSQFTDNPLGLGQLTGKISNYTKTGRIGAVEEGTDVNISMGKTEITLIPGYILLPFVLFRMVQVVLGMAFFVVVVILRFTLNWNFHKKSIANARTFSNIITLLGGAFVKIGQQMSIRLDLLPPEYCNELSKLLDHFPPIKFNTAKKLIERQLGKSLQEAFKDGHIEFIGSASIGCVYKAQLKTGEDVALKVKRPNVNRKFQTDLFCLDLTLKFFEFITLVRPGMTQKFRSELKQILLEEMNFYLEVRYQELFRRYYKRNKKLKITAPKIYYHLCNEKLIVSEYVEGYSLKSIIDAIKTENEPFLAELEAKNISIKKIAKRLIRSSYYGFFECPFFHSDPHPGNIIVQPDNNIIMLDFGACGVFSETNRNLMRQMYYHQGKKDVAGMVQCVITLMEPLPPIDMDSFTKELEQEWWKGYYGILSKHAAWWEKSSMRLWLALLKLVNKYNITVPGHVLRMIRATLLYDTVAAQLYPKIDVFAEYRKYHERFGKKLKKKMIKSFTYQMLTGPTWDKFVRLDQMMDTGNLLLFKVRRLLDLPMPNFNSMSSKIYDLAVELFEMVVQFSIVTLVGILIFKLSVDDPQAELNTVMETHVHYLVDTGDVHKDHLQGVIALWFLWFCTLVFIHLRRIMWRIKDKEVK